MKRDDFLKTVAIGDATYDVYDINALERQGLATIGRLPFCIRVLVENLLRHLDGRVVTEDDLMQVAGWRQQYAAPVEIPFHPARVLTQDFTGVPAVVDLAAMCDAMGVLGRDPGQINPLVPVDLIIDHSVQVDHHGTAGCQRENIVREYRRNAERYALLKWAQQRFANFRIIPPRAGICHQVNLEYLAGTFMTATVDGHRRAFPESLIGTDSHTTMINGIGVLGWGVGGIEAEAVMLGQPYYMAIPEVIGVKLTGRLNPGVTATDLALHVTQALRRIGVVEKFVEYFGPGMRALSIPQRATLANMAPEYGATTGFMPLDEKTIDYLKQTARAEQAAVAEACARALNLFYTGDADPDYTAVHTIALEEVVPAVAGPSRPHQHIPLTEVKPRITADAAPAATDAIPIDINGRPATIRDASVVMAAITSCTNTANPALIMGAGLLARNAVGRGLFTPPHVKTVLAPGSRVVARYLSLAGLMPYLEALGFHLVGFGCLTCIGNSGPLHPGVEKTIRKHDLNVAAVISGNRNFEARIHPRIKSNYLASPLLVIAFALAGRMDIDLTEDPLGLDPNGQPVYLREIWPTDDAIARQVAAFIAPDDFGTEYSRILDGDDRWQSLGVAKGRTFAWDAHSTYVRRPPYFENFQRQPAPVEEISGARALLLLGDGVTTDHISPGGSIAETYPAGRFLIQAGVAPVAFNSYGARRGNHEVMIRGTFGNVRLANRLAAPQTGSFTRHFPDNAMMPVFDAAMAYQAEGVPLVVLAGREYGTGSSRDWAAKGTRLLGVRAVLAESFERIHRSNLVGMGVLPLVFRPGQNADTLGLTGTERFDIAGITAIVPKGTVQVTAHREDGTTCRFAMIARLDTAIEVDYFRHGGILPFVLRNRLAA